MERATFSSSLQQMHRTKKLQLGVRCWNRLINAWKSKKFIKWDLNFCHWYVLLKIWKLFLFKIFDMKKFQSNVNRELSRAYPDRRRLETQCLSIISFVKSESDILECPIWIMIINVVAMDMLKSKLPPGKSLSIIMQISKRSLLRNYRSSMEPRNINTILWIFFCFHSFNYNGFKSWKIEWLLLQALVLGHKPQWDWNKWFAFI